jgi:hypothetical protein
MGSHPYIGQKCMNGFGVVGTVMSYVTGRFRIDSDNPKASTYKDEKEVARMIARYDAKYNQTKEKKQ